MNKLNFLLLFFIVFPFSFYGQNIFVNEDFDIDKGFEKYSIYNSSNFRNDTIEKLEIYYLEQSINHRIRVLNTQHIISIIIFSVVLLIVFIGLFFAYKHFYLFLSEKNIKIDTEIQISSKGIKVNSSIIGIIILTISIVFFYLYLIYVFPISEVRTNNIRNNETLTTNIVHLADSTKNEDDSNK